MNSLWDILSVAIGVSFVFTILSLLNSWVQEYIASAFSLRANNLANIMQNMLEPAALMLNGRKKVFAQGKEDENDVARKLDTNAVKAFYDHPIIYSLSRPGALPAYIPSSDFTVALLDLLNKAGSRKKDDDSSEDEITMENIKRGISRLEGPLKARLKSLLDSAQINKNKTKVEIEDFRNTVTAWFDATIDRGRSWYKRKMQIIGILCGLAIAILLNADTVGISVSLWQNAVLRESISQAAVVYAEKGDNANAKEAQQQLLNLGLPIGWSFRFADRDPATADDPRDFPSTFGGWLSKSIGLVLTGFAISQGSQVWFDLMNRLINLRVTGLKSEAEEQPAKEKEKEKE